jgi:hypothetical protein
VCDDGHGPRAVLCSQACQIVAEDDIDDPVKAVLNAPMAADRPGEGLGIEFG